ncbi:FxLYD domain-containing protein [Fredinandcohnia humi]
MNRLEAIIKDIKEFGLADHILSFREVQDLPTILFEDESILFITLGTFESKKGLLLATDERVLFVYTDSYITKSIKIPYGELEHVYQEKQEIESTLELFVQNKKVVIKNIPSIDIPPFVDIVQDYMEVSFIQNDRMRTSIETGETTPRKKSSIFRLFGCFGVVAFIFVLFLIGTSIYDEVTTDEYGIEEGSSSSVDEEFEDYEVDHEPPEYALSAQEAETEYSLVISELETTHDDYYEYIVGTIKNNSDQEYSSIYVDIQLFDKDGNVIDSTIDSLERFKPGQTWAFKTEYYNKNAVEFKISGITVFK